MNVVELGTSTLPSIHDFGWYLLFQLSHIICLQIGTYIIEVKVEDDNSESDPDGVKSVIR